MKTPTAIDNETTRMFFTLMDKASRGDEQAKSVIYNALKSFLATYKEEKGKGENAAD